MLCSGFNLHMPNGQICLVCRIYELAGLDGIACNVVINAEFVQCIFKTALGVIARGRHCGIALEHVVHALYIVGGAGAGAFGKAYSVAINSNDILQLHSSEHTFTGKSGDSKCGLCTHFTI